MCTECKRLWSELSRLADKDSLKVTLTAEQSIASWTRHGIPYRVSKAGADPCALLCHAVEHARRRPSAAQVLRHLVGAGRAVCTVGC